MISPQSHLELMVCELDVLQASAFKEAVNNVPQTKVTTLPNGLRVATEQVCSSSLLSLLTILWGWGSYEWR